MRSSTDLLLRVFEAAREKRNRIIAGLLVLSLLVFAGVLWQLRYTGITMTSAPICGIEAHEHTEESCECEYVLIDSAVTLEEAAAQYTVYVLTDAGYTALIDVAAEATEPQYDAYYQMSYICGIEEHIHSTGCYCDPTADVEDASVWESKLPDDLTGVWSEDVVKIAASQIGYSESIENFQLSDTGERMGYTRYGQWYNADYPYGKWDSMFVSFCLHYAGITEEYMPYASGADSWTVKLTEAGLYHSGNGELKPGFIVFFDTDLDGDADRTGIVESINEDGTITVIEGDSFAGTEAADQVMRNIYLATEPSIFGYSVLPEQPVVEEDTAVFYSMATMSLNDGTATAAVDGATDFSKYVSSVGFDSVEYNAEKKAYITDFVLLFGDTEATKLTKGDVVAANYTYYYMLPANMDVTAETAAGSYTVQLQKEDYTWVDAFDYTIKSDDGGETWYILIEFRQDFINSLLSDTSALDGGLDFEAYFDEGEQNSEGDIVVDIEGENDITIDSGDITYDDNTEDSSATTKHYDVAIEKSGYYDSVNSEIIYTIVVVSENGTPAENLIELTDTISANGDYIALPISDFKVGQRIYKSDSDGSSVELTYLTEGENGYSVTLPSDGTDLFTASLPQILDLTPDGTEDTENAYTTEYIITYSVSLENTDPNMTYSPENKIVLNNTDDVYGENITVTDGEVVNVSQNMLSKSSSADYNSDVVTWTITVNAAGESGDNIKGSLLTDDMFAQVVSYETVTDEETGEITYNFTESSDITVSPSSAYHWELIDGKPAIVFDETQSGTGTNYNTYKIEYKTPLESSWGYTEVLNTAYLDPDPGNGLDTDRYRGDAKYACETTNLGKTLMPAGAADANGTKVLNWQLTVPVPDAGITAGSHFEDILNYSYSSKDGLNAIDVSYITYNQITDIINNYQSLTVGDSGVGFTDFSLYFYGYDTSESTYYYYYYDKASGQWYRSNYECYDHNAHDTSWDGVITYYYTATDVPEDVKFTKFRFVFDSTMDAETYGEGNITINYSSTFESAKVFSELTTTNRIWNNPGNYAEAPYTQRATVFKTDQNGNVAPSEYSSKTGIITWHVKVIIPDDYTAGTPITITDTLPNGVTLDSVTINYRNQWNNGDLNASGVINGGDISFDCGHYDENNSWAWAADTTSVTGAVSGNTVIINVHDATNLNISGQNSFVIIYNCQINDFANDELYADGYEFGPFTNSASAALGDDPNYGSASQTQTIIKEVEEETGLYFPQSKKGSFDSKSQLLNYSVDINPAKNPDLNPDGDTVTVTDKMWYSSATSHWQYGSGTMSLTLVYSSVKLYYPETDETGAIIYYSDKECTTVSTNGGYMKADTNNPVPDTLWQWGVDVPAGQPTSSGNDNYLYITVTLPDGIAAVLEYSYSVTSTLDNDEEHGRVYAQNTFKDADGTEKYDTAEYYYEYANKDGFINTSVSFVIYKHETGDMGEALGGAVFTLYEYTGDSANPWVAIDDSIVTVEGTGRAVIEWDAQKFKKNTAYYIIETEAPEGYICPPQDEDHRYYFYFLDDTSEEMTMPPDFVANYDPFDFTGDTHIENVANDIAKTTSITVNKSWKDINGNDQTMNNADPVEVELHQVTSYVKAADSIINSGSGSTGSGDNTGTAEANTKALTAVLTYVDIGFDPNGTDDPATTDSDERFSGSWATLTPEATLTLSSDENANPYTLRYTISLADIKSQADWVTQASNNPNVYLQINGLNDLLTAKGLTYQDVKLESVTVTMDGTSTDYTDSAVTNLDSEFQVNVFNPWTNMLANKTWTSEAVFEFKLNIPTVLDPIVNEGNTETDTEVGETLSTPTVGNIDSSYIVSDVVIQTGTISADGNWTASFADLPQVGTLDGQTVYYSYYVIEKSVPGYTASYDNITDNQIVTKMNGTITVINTSEEGYELPETGSIGTVLLTVNALLFMVVPVMYFFRRRETLGAEK